MQFVAEYIWLDGKDNLRSKSRTVTVNIPTSDKNISRQELESSIKEVGLYKDWSYDGSSTYQADTTNSEIKLKPCAVYIDPFRRAPNVLVLCGTYDPATGNPMSNCLRPWAKEQFDKAPILKPWFGLEQEFYIMKTCVDHVTEKSVTPLGWGNNSPNKQGQYYCSVGSTNAFGRIIAEKAYHLCLEAGLNASGMNAEVGIAQWEIQIGPCQGVSAADQVMIMRYIMARVAEQHGAQINIDPKPIKSSKGDWNGSGCHINYSTLLMREGGSGRTGLEYINDAIERLRLKHDEHMVIYGTNNKDRLSGSCETSSYDNFTSGVGDRGASIRIPIEVNADEQGYLEDRRPAANINPYLTTATMFKTTCLDIVGDSGDLESKSS